MSNQRPELKRIDMLVKHCNVCTVFVHIKTLNKIKLIIAFSKN